MHYGRVCGLLTLDPYSKGIRCRWFCDRCRRTTTNADEFSWHCDKCHYDECGVCYTKTHAVSEPYPHPHLLVAQLRPYNIESWFCNLCHVSVSDLAMTSWHCAQCCYDECDDCHTKQSRLMIAPTQPALVETHENIFDNETRLVLEMSRLDFESRPAPRMLMSVPVPVSSVEQNDITLCVICMTRPRTHAWSACGHFSYCEPCIDRILDPTTPAAKRHCSMCRAEQAPGSGKTRIYL